MNTEPPTPAAIARGQHRGWRILVVDDDEDALHLDCMLLSRAGYTVDTASDGEEAWTMLLSSSYDLLLSDHNMPRLCGLDLAGRMRAAGMTVPIIINSGCHGLGNASSHPRLNLAAILQKPFEFTEVLDAVRSILPLPLDGMEETVCKGQVIASNVIPLRFVRPVPVPVQTGGITT